MPTDPNLPADVIRLVCAAREVAFVGATKDALKELDEASEAFADRVEWENEPDADLPTAEDVRGILAAGVAA